MPPVSIRGVIIKKLFISPSLIEKIKPVCSEFALSSCSKEVFETIKNHGNYFLLIKLELDSATNGVLVTI